MSTTCSCLWISIHFIFLHILEMLYLRLWNQHFHFNVLFLRTYKLMIASFARLKLSCVISLGKMFFNKFANRNAVNSLIFLTIWKYRIDISLGLDFHRWYSHIIQKCFFFKNINFRTTTLSAYQWLALFHFLMLMKLLSIGKICRWSPTKNTRWGWRHKIQSKELSQGYKAQILSTIPCIICCDAIDKSERPSKDEQLEWDLWVTVHLCLCVSA